MENCPCKVYIVIEFEKEINSYKLSTLDGDSNNYDCENKANSKVKKFLLLFNEFLTKKVQFKVQPNDCIIIDASDKKFFRKHVIYNLINNDIEYVLPNNYLLKQLIQDFDFQLVEYINFMKEGKDPNSGVNSMIGKNLKDSSDSFCDVVDDRNNDHNNVSDNFFAKDREKFLGKFAWNLCKEFIIHKNPDKKMFSFLNGDVYEKNQNIEMLFTKSQDESQFLNVCDSTVNQLHTEVNMSVEDYYKLSTITISKDKHLRFVKIELSPLFLKIKNKIKNKEISNLYELKKQIIAEKSVSRNIKNNNNLNDKNNKMKKSPFNFDEEIGISKKEHDDQLLFKDDKSMMSKNEPKVPKIAASQDFDDFQKNFSAADFGKKTNVKVSAESSSSSKLVKNEKSKLLNVPSLKISHEMEKMTFLQRHSIEDQDANGYYCYKIWIQENSIISKGSNFLDKLI